MLHEAVLVNVSCSPVLLNEDIWNLGICINLAGYFPQQSGLNDIFYMSVIIQHVHP